MSTQSGFRLGREQLPNLLTSKGSARIRELFLRTPVLCLPASPVLYSMVLYFDRRKPNMPGQVLVATAFKPPIPNTEPQPRGTSHSPEDISSLPYANSLSSN